VCALRRVITVLLLATSFAMGSRDARAQSLPSGWAAADVGSPALSGTSSYSSGVYTIEGAGADVWGSADQFRYVYQRLTGDVTVIARVTAVENTDPWAKAGVMIRESLSAGSKHAFASVTPSQGVAFQRRRSTGGSSVHTGVSGAVAVWLRLDRRGSTLTASRSSDGASWTTIGSDTISMSSTVYVGLAVTSHNTSTRATGRFTSVSATLPSQPALPSGWANRDIGGPSLAGSTAYGSGRFTVRGAGSNIWNSSDQFHFAYRQFSGDVNVIARVASMTSPDSLSKAGLMIRSTLQAGSAHASVFLRGNNEVVFQGRPSAGSSSLHTSGGSGSAPVWLKLERRGSAVTAFRSSDGSSWRMIGSQTLTVTSTFYVGLAVTSRKTSALATGVFEQVAVQAPSGSSNTPPTVSLTSPSSGSTFTAPATVSLAASASDADGGVARVEFYAGGTLLGSDTTSPYSFSWSSVPAGSYTLTAVARDTAGATTTSSSRSITVSGSTSGNTPPSVSLTAPSSGATYVAPASITISASASDADGSIARVDFYRGSTLIASDTTSPYSVSWTSVAAGSYTLTAVARDNGGASTTSAARSIIVNNPTPPTRAVFSPSADHNTMVTSYYLEIFTAGVNPGTSTPMATKNLGKPAIVNGECTADIETLILALPSGSYFAAVSAVSSGGRSPRATSPTFAR
jgi:regulation of enolase protein 1 (concanavalin A-like superfamily)